MLLLVETLRYSATSPISEKPIQPGSWKQFLQEIRIGSSPDRKHSKKGGYAGCGAYRQRLLCFTVPATTAELRGEQNIKKTFREVTSLVKTEFFLFNPECISWEVLLTKKRDNQVLLPAVRPLLSLWGNWVHQDESSLLGCGLLLSHMASEKGTPCFPEVVETRD